MYYGIHLEEHSEEQRALALVQQCRAEGVALRKIGARLEAKGILPRSGGQWNPATILSMTRAAA